MKWSIGELRRYKEEALNFSETIDVNDALTARDNEVLAVTPVTVEGILSVGKNEYILHYRLKTIVTVPSARSLEPVDLPLDLSVDEVFMTREQWSSMEEERDEEILVLDNLLTCQKAMIGKLSVKKRTCRRKRNRLKQLILVLRNYLSYSMNQKMTSKIGIKCISK